MNKLKKSIQFYRPLSYYIIAVILLLPLYTAIKTYILSNNAYIIEVYSSFLFNFSSIIAKLAGNGEIVKNAISIDAFKINTILMSLWQSIVFLALIFTLPLKKLHKIALILLCVFLIIGFNTSRILLLSFNSISWHCFSTVMLNNILILLLNATFIYALIIWFRNHYSLKKLLLDRLKIPSEQLREISNKAIWALGVLIIINFITNTQIIPVISYMVLGILKSSEAILNYFGYTAVLINDRLIQGPSAGIFFSDSCLGLELIMTFSLFIAILQGKLINKIWFITSGIAIIYGLNIVRITLIFIHLVKNQGNYTWAINYHDLYSYPVYIVVFILWVIWINYLNKKPVL